MDLKRACLVAAAVALVVVEFPSAQMRVFVSLYTQSSTVTNVQISSPN